jgi:hypothetical protein
MTVMGIRLQRCAQVGREKRSVSLGPQQCTDQVKQQTRGNQSGKGIIEDHDRALLKALSNEGNTGSREENASESQSRSQA